MNTEDIKRAVDYAKAWSWLPTATNNNAWTAETLISVAEALKILDYAAKDFPKVYAALALLHHSGLWPEPGGHDEA